MTKPDQELSPFEVMTAISLLRIIIAIIFFPRENKINLFIFKKMGLSHSYYPERKNKPSPFPRIMNNFHNWCCSQLESQQTYYLLSRSLASRLFPLAMQWCKGVLPWKSRVFTSAPNCSNNSSINGLPMSHARCNKEQP